MKNLSEKEVVELLFPESGIESFMNVSAHRIIESIDHHLTSTLMEMEEVASIYKDGLITKNEMVAQTFSFCYAHHNLKALALGYAKISDDFYNGYLFAKEMI